MGQKVNPIGYRLALQKDWRSKWYATGKEYSDNLHTDLAVRKYLGKNLQFAALSKVFIERAFNSVRITLSTARPGLVIGRKGSEIERMQTEISAICGGRPVKIDIYEIKQPELDAQLVAENVAVQLERRISFRRAMKRAVQTTMDFGAEGIRIRCAGRLGGADIARAEWYRKGKVPLQTLRVPIDYGFCEARTVYGIIGVKCWINKKEVDETEEKKGEAGRSRVNTGGRQGARQGAPRAEGGAQPPTAPAPEAIAAATAAASLSTGLVEGEGEAEEERDLGRVFESRPDQVDDLKKIAGIGPQLEEKLNKLGVYNYSQIAEWETDQIETFDDLLSFKGRIERDEWISQAKEFGAKSS